MSDTVYTNLKWPSRGPDFNTWYTGLPTFARLLDAASDLGWWIQDTKYKYINIRVDTRNTGFLVFAAHSIDYNAAERVSPDDVLHLIIKYLVNNKPTLIERFQRVSSFEEIIEIVERRVRQANIKARTKSVDENSTEETVPLAIATKINVGGCVGEISSITDKYVTVEGSYMYPPEEGIKGFSEPWEFVYSLISFEKIDKYRLDPQGGKIWDASELVCATNIEIVK